MELFLLIAVVVVVIIGIVLLSGYTKMKRLEDLERRRAALIAKYRDPQIVDKIMQQMFWQGQSQEQLLDSLGRPADIDQKVMKTKVKEIWKYNHMGANRFGLRITIENKVVVGWDQKD
ncbi:MAG TPA: hypothetical protein VGW39_00225 [Chthoniobacterales bacterium]|nr:hypothetical protein [Chthoniobacterales bacterium]